MAGKLYILLRLQMNQANRGRCATCELGPQSSASPSFAVIGALVSFGLLSEADYKQIDHIALCCLKTKKF